MNFFTVSSNRNSQSCNFNTASCEFFRSLPNPMFVRHRLILHTAQLSLLVSTYLGSVFRKMDPECGRRSTELALRRLQTPPQPQTAKREHTRRSQLHTSSAARGSMRTEAGEAWTPGVRGDRGELRAGGAALRGRGARTSRGFRGDQGVRARRAEPALPRHRPAPRSPRTRRAGGAAGPLQPCGAGTRPLSVQSRAVRSAGLAQSGGRPTGAPSRGAPPRARDAAESPPQGAGGGGGG